MNPDFEPEQWSPDGEHWPESDSDLRPTIPNQGSKQPPPLPTEQSHANIAPNLGLPESSSTRHAPMKSSSLESIVSSSAISVRPVLPFYPEVPSKEAREQGRAPASQRTVPAVPWVTGSKSLRIPLPAYPNVSVGRNTAVEILDIERDEDNEADASSSDPDWIWDMLENVPSRSIELSIQNDNTLRNRGKALIESCTGYRWDWWPLQPCVPVLPPGMWRLQWEVSLRGASRDFEGLY
jgi:hypothetical protein